MTGKEPQQAESETTSSSSTRRRFLGGALGVAASAAGLTGLSGLAAAHFPLALDIEIQPGTDENALNLSGQETIQVAVHSTEYVNSDGKQKTLDPTEKDVRYRFGSRFALEDGGGARPADGGEVTTLGEGDDAAEVLLLTFPVGETGFDGGEETGWLYWERDESGEHGLSGAGPLRVSDDAASDSTTASGSDAS